MVSGGCVRVPLSEEDAHEQLVLIDASVYEGFLG